MMTIEDIMKTGIFALVAEIVMETLRGAKAGAAEVAKETVKDKWGGLSSPIDELKDAQILQGMNPHARRVWDHIELGIYQKYGPGAISQFFAIRNSSKRRVEWAAQAVDHQGRLLGSKEREHIVREFLQVRRSALRAGRSRKKALTSAHAAVDIYLRARGFPMPGSTGLYRKIDDSVAAIPVATRQAVETLKGVPTKVGDVTARCVPPVIAGANATYNAVETHINNCDENPGQNRLDRLLFRIFS